MSLFVREGFEQRAAIRAEYEDLFWAQYEAAEIATNGHLLNRRGATAGIDPVQLFRANAAFRAAYASEELHDYWAARPHLSFAAYERQRFNHDTPRHAVAVGK